MKKYKLTILATLFFAAINAPANHATITHHNKSLRHTKNIKVDTIESKLKAQAPNLDSKVLKLALKAYYKAREQGYDTKQILSVIDFSLPTYEKSLWVFNLNTDTLLYHTYVAHGKASGNTKATYFSNKNGSKASSLGLYLTGDTYYGNDGLSLKLKGLSGKFNDNAFNRTVVMHGAWYVNKHFVNEHHRVGRSWGCPAVSKSMIKPIANTIKNGTLIFAYGNNSNWLKHGPYVA